MDRFVDRVHAQIERYTSTHGADRSEVEVELAGGERLTLQSLSAEPGFGFVTLTVHPGTGHAFMAPHNALGTLNAAVAERIWPEVVSFLRENLG